MQYDHSFRFRDQSLLCPHHTCLLDTNIPWNNTLNNQYVGAMPLPKLPITGQGKASIIILSLSLYLLFRLAHEHFTIAQPKSTTCPNIKVNSARFDYKLKVLRQKSLFMYSNIDQILSLNNSKITFLS